MKGLVTAILNLFGIVVLLLSLIIIALAAHVSERMAPTDAMQMIQWHGTMQ
jgi:hypothetical protein